MFSLGWLPQLKKKFLFGCPFQLSEWQNKWPENCVPHLHCIQLCTWHHRSSKRDRITRRFFESFMSFYSSQTRPPILLSTLFSKRKIFFENWARVIRKNFNWIFRCLNLVWETWNWKLIKNTWSIDAKILVKNFKIQANFKVSFLRRNAEMSRIKIS